MSLAQELHLDKPFEDLRHETLLNVVHTANYCVARGETLFRRFDLTQAQFNILFALRDKRVDLTQSDLGERLVVTRATITSVLDRLEQKGFVARRNVPGNRRIYHVELTATGRRLIDKIEPVYRREVHHALSVLSEKECRTLIGLLERIRAQASRPHDQG